MTEKALFNWDQGRESSPADMFKAVYDTNNDGSVDKADAIDGIAAAGNSKYYGTDSSGTAGFHDLPAGGSGDMTKAVYDPDDDGSVKSADAVPWTGVTGKPSNYPAEAHNLLSAGHGDTLAASVAAGDLLIGNSTPKWARLAKGSLGQVLRMGASLPEWISDDGWIPRSETWTRLSNTTFWVTGDLTAVFVPGTKIKVTQTSTKYFYVVSSSYSSPSTTVTITGGSDYNLTASPTERWISYVANPQGFPQWFNYAPTWGGFSSAPTVAAAVFTITGRMVTVVVNCSGNGTSNATTLTCTLPIAAAYAGRGAAGYAVNNGSALTVAGRIYVAAASDYVRAYTDMGTGAWTNSGGKRLDFCLTYGI